MEKLLLEPEKPVSLCIKDALHQVAVDKMSSKLPAGRAKPGIKGYLGGVEPRRHLWHLE